MFLGWRARRAYLATAAARRRDAEAADKAAQRIAEDATAKAERERIILESAERHKTMCTYADIFGALVRAGRSGEWPRPVAAQLCTQAGTVSLTYRVEF